MTTLRLTSLLAVLMLPCGLIDAQDKPQQGTLYWANGDSLPGQLIENEGGQLTWKSSLFREPLTIDTAALEKVSFDHSSDIVTTDEAFRIITRSGNVLHGQIANIKGEWILVRSKRHGEVRLNREQIRSLRRLDNPSLIFLGPVGLNGWTTPARTRKVTDWQTTDEGYLTTRREKAELFRPLDIPGRAEIEVVLSTTGKIYNFTLGLKEEFQSEGYLETWDDTLVALYGDDFVEVTEIDPKKDLTLRIYWDEESHQMSVYSAEGARLGEIKGESTSKKQSGFFLRNTTGQLTLKKLRVSHWDGSPPKPIEKGLNRIHMVDGTILYGRITSYDGATLKLTTSDDEETEVKLQDLDSVYLADDLKAIIDGNTTVTWLDGSRATGDLVGIKDGQISLKTNYAETLLISDLAKSNRLLFDSSKSKAPKGVDRLICAGGELHGTLVGNGGDKGAAALRWKPSGGLNSSSLAPDCDARFVRGRNKDQKITYDTKKFSDLLFLISGDIVPCSVTAINKETIEIATAFGDATKIPHDNVKAIELSSTETVSRSGFDDLDWKLTGTKNKKDGDVVTFNANGTLSHKNAFTAGDAKFKLQWDPQTYGTINIRLFGENGRTGRTNLSLYLRSNLIYVMGQMNRGQTQTINLSKPEAEVQFRVKDKKLAVLVNKRVMLDRVPVNPKGGGISFNVQPTRRNGANSASLKISKFDASRGNTVRQFVDSEARQRALTVPRFRRERPSTHVLIAPNGDLLRGKLLGMTPTHVTFSSRLEDFRFERNRISAVVWLHPSGETEQPAPAADAPIVRTVLNGGLGLVLVPERMTEEKLFGKSPVLGNCSVPVGAIRELFAGRYERKGEKFAYADWSVTRGMEPRWDMEEGEGDPALRMVGQKADDFTIKTLDGKEFTLSEVIGGDNDTYVVLDFWATWCGPCIRAMPEYLSAIERINSKRVRFVGVNQDIGGVEEVQTFIKRRVDALKAMEDAKEDTADVPDWRKLFVVLDPDGDVAKKLEVSAIPHTVIVGPDGTIEWVHTGFAPGDGEKLEANLVAMLDGTWERPKQPAKTISGTDSRLVGTTPKDFKLDMLGGKPFTLSKAKGKVVILDFWATWCGPCVRALPEYEKIMTELDGSKVQFIAVNQEEKEGLIKAFVDRKKMKLPVGVDPDGKVGKIFNCENLPQTVIIGPDGKIAWLHVGYKTGVAEAMKAKVLELLGTAPTADGKATPAAAE